MQTCFGGQYSEIMLADSSSHAVLYYVKSIDVPMKHNFCDCCHNIGHFH